MDLSKHYSFEEAIFWPDNTLIMKAPLGTFNFILRAFFSHIFQEKYMALQNKSGIEVLKVLFSEMKRS